jgi:D-alanyl-D-alanine carboxypeptidase (penicillin-binding protein 5/6)
VLSACFWFYRTNFVCIYIYFIKTEVLHRERMYTPIRCNTGSAGQVEYGAATGIIPPFVKGCSTMKKRLKSAAAVLLAVCMAIGFAVPARADEVSGTAAETSGVFTEYAGEDPYEPLDESVPALASGVSEVSAKSAVLLEISTGRLLFEQNPDERLAPASITKIMSLLLVMEAFDKGNFALDTQVSASEYACSMGGSQIWLEPGETMTVDELLKAAFIASANDATVALAELVAGTEEAFVAKMNARAIELGMQNTTFVNATGLDAEGHLTTARDVALMSAELLRHELVKNYSTVWMDSLRGGQSELVNTNKLIRFYEGATGLKTGTTSTAGHCLSASAARNGMELVAVVMGSENSKDRFNAARQLLDYGFASYARVEISPAEELLQNVPVSGGTAESVSVTFGAPLSLLVSKGREGEIVQDCSMVEAVEAPVGAGQKLGEIVLTLDGEELGRIELTAGESVEKMSFFAALSRLLQSLFAL